jgi:hypothetical protein
MCVTLQTLAGSLITDSQVDDLMEFYEKSVPRATALASPAVRATLAQLDAQAVAHSPAASAEAAAAATRRSSTATAAGAGPNSSATGSAFFGQGTAAGWEAAAAAATTAAGVQAGEDIAEAEAQVHTAVVLTISSYLCYLHVCYPCQLVSCAAAVTCKYAS